MIEIKYKTWDEISIDTFQELKNIQSDNDMTLLVERLAIMADCDPEEIRKLTIPEFKKLQEGLQFITSDIPIRVDTIFELEGQEYGMIPQLDFITAGEWIDAENWKGEPESNIHFYAALLYRPVTLKRPDGSYEIEPHKPQGFMARANLFKSKLPITRIHGTVLFFSSLGITLMPILADFSTSELTQIQKTMKTKQTQTAMKTRKEKPFKKGGASMI